MKILIAGVCGFIGSTLARALSRSEGVEVIVNLSRRGSETNRPGLEALNVEVRHCDVRIRSDLELIPTVDWVIDAAANPAVRAGADGVTSSRQLLEHNVVGTINLLELCKTHGAWFILLSTSRVYSMDHLRGLPLEESDGAFRLGRGSVPAGVTARGVAEEFCTSAPLSLYGASKRASEVIALEYAHAFGLPVWVNRCGLMAGAGQFAYSGQGIVAFWIHAWLRKQPLEYFGFGGRGAQVRDCFHPVDLIPLLVKQMERAADGAVERIVNVGGGYERAISLAQLSAWCERRFGPHTVGSNDAPREFDVPWLVLDSSRAEELWEWRPSTALSPRSSKKSPCMPSRTLSGFV